MNEIKPAELLAVLRRVESRGAVESAHRIRTICSQVFRYAVASGRAERDPSADLRDALTPASPKAMAAITDPREVGDLLRAIDGYSGTHVVRCALKLAPLVFLRPGELRKGEWSEIDFKERAWTIPASRMKAGKKYRVPLSGRCIEILERAKELLDSGTYVFPGRSPKKPLSTMVFLMVIRRMGKDITAHGFRSTFRDWAAERTNFSREVCEMALAHSVSDKTEAAYLRGDLFDKRRDLMDTWGSYACADKGDKVVTLRQTSA